jgi:hypothetical protein
MSATRLPNIAAASAPLVPAGPPPMTTRSNSVASALFIVASPGANGRARLPGSIAPADTSRNSSSSHTGEVAVTSADVAARRRFLPPSLQAARPTTSDTFTNFDVTPDGRFIMVRTTSAMCTAGHIDVIVNFFDMLKRGER